MGRAPVHPWTSLVPVRTRIVEEPVTAVSLTTLASGAVVADFGKVYAAVPTVRFHRGVAGHLVTMRAGYLLDQPVVGQPFTGTPGQVSKDHGTQHTDMSYGYVQRGGEEQFHPFDYLGFRYFQIDDPGEDLGPGGRGGTGPAHRDARPAAGLVLVVGTHHRRRIPTRCRTPRRTPHRSSTSTHRPA